MCAGVCVPLLRRYRRLASTARLAFARPGRHATGAARRGSSSSRGCHRGGVDLLDLLGQPRIGQRGQTARDAPSRDSRCGSPPASGTSPPPGSSSSPPRSARRSLLRLAGFPGEKAAAFLRISRSIRNVRFSRRNRASSSRSSVERPSGRLPSSCSACLTQLRSVTSETPGSSAI